MGQSDMSSLGWGKNYSAPSAASQGGTKQTGLIQDAVGKGYSKDMETTRRVLVDPLNIFPGMASGPQKQFLGGSPEALTGMRQDFQAGNQVGQGIQSQGVSALGTGLGQAGGVYDAATGTGAGMGQQLFNQGGSIGANGLGVQSRAVDYVRDVAASNEPARLAGLQAQQALAQSQRNTLAQGRTGGLLGLRSAMAENAVSGANVASQSAVTAAQLEQQRKADMLGAEQLAAQVGGSQAGLGYGQQGQGAGVFNNSLGTANQSAGITANTGGQLGQLGLGTQQLYAGLGLEANKTQFEGDQKQAEAANKAKSGFIGDIFGIASRGASKMGGSK